MVFIQLVFTVMLIQLNKTVPIVYLKLFNFNENDLKLLFENVEDD